jgi:hypothetical protein
MAQFIGTTSIMFFYTARKNETLNHKTNNIKEQERTGNNQVTGNIMGTILGYIMATLEFVRTNIDDLLCITKSSLGDHLSKLKRVFIRL